MLLIRNSYFTPLNDSISIWAVSNKGLGGPVIDEIGKGKEQKMANIKSISDFISRLSQRGQIREQLKAL